MMFKKLKQKELTAKLDGNFLAKMKVHMKLQNKIDFYHHCYKNVLQHKMMYL